MNIEIEWLVWIHAIVSFPNLYGVLGIYEKNSNWIAFKRYQRIDHGNIRFTEAFAHSLTKHSHIVSFIFRTMKRKFFILTNFHQFWHTQPFVPHSFLLLRCSYYTIYVVVISILTWYIHMLMLLQKEKKEQSGYTKVRTHTHSRGSKIVCVSFLLKRNGNSRFLLLQLYPENVVYTLFPCYLGINFVTW